MAARSHFFECDSIDAQETRTDAADPAIVLVTGHGLEIFGLGDAYPLAARALAGIEPARDGEGRIEQQAAFHEAVADAQREGFAESDPADDLSGADAAAKLAILCSIAWREPVTVDQVRVRGIDASVTETVDAAREYGKRVRLVASARRNGRLHASVEPIVLDEGDPLATGTGVHNVVEVRTALAGTLTWHGAGAGGRSTASALLADTIAAARALSTRHLTLRPLPRPLAGALR